MMTLSDADFHRLYTYIQSHYGIDLSQKKQLISSRLSHSLQAQGYTSFTQYVDDILSEAYLKVYKYSRSFKKDLNGFNWMHEIIKNLALDHNRNILKEDNCSFNENFHHSDVTDNPLIKDRNLRIAMKTLTDEEQKIIYLRIWENRTLNDIADSLSANVTFIYRVYTKALEKLKRNLSN